MGAPLYLNVGTSQLLLAKATDNGDGTATLTTADAAAATRTATGSITTASGAATDYAIAAVPGAKGVAVQLSASWASGTLIAEGTVDGVAWTALAFISPVTGALYSSLTQANVVDGASGVYYVPNGGMAKVRVRATAISLAGGKTGVAVAYSATDSMPHFTPQAVVAPVVGQPPGVARTSFTTVVQVGSAACVRGFWLCNPGTVRFYYAPQGATAPAADGSNSYGFIEPGERKWFGLSNSNLLQVVSSSGTAYYSVDGE